MTKLVEYFPLIVKSFVKSCKILVIHFSEKHLVVLLLNLVARLPVWSLDHLVLKVKLLETVVPMVGTVIPTIWWPKRRLQRSGECLVRILKNMCFVIWKHVWKYVWVKKYVKIRVMLFKNWKHVYHTKRGLLFHLYASYD